MRTFIVTLASSAVLFLSAFTAEAYMDKGANYLKLDVTSNDGTYYGAVTCKDYSAHYIQAGSTYELHAQANAVCGLQ